MSSIFPAPAWNPLTLADFDLDLAPDPEDVDLDQEAYAPMRPTLGFTSPHTFALGDDAYAIAVWERLQRQERTGPVRCPTCTQLVKYEMYDAHRLQHLYDDRSDH